MVQNFSEDGGEETLESVEMSFHEKDDVYIRVVVQAARMIDS